MSISHQYEKLSERMEFILGGRTRNPWGDALGISSGSVTSIFKDNRIPAAEILTKIRRAENASINWLVDGEGKPFSVNHCDSDEDAAALIQMHLADVQWAVYIAYHERKHVIVLECPVQSQLKDGGMYSWHDIEIITCPQFDIDTAQILQKLGDEYVTPVEFLGDDLNNLRNGYLGTYALFGDEKSRGLLNMDLTASRTQELKNLLQRMPETTDMAMRKRLNKLGQQDLEMLDAFQRLGGEDKGRVVKMVKGLAPEE